MNLAEGGKNRESSRRKKNRCSTGRAAARLVRCVAEGGRRQAQGARSYLEGSRKHTQGGRRLAEGTGIWRREAGDIAQGAPQRALCDVWRREVGS